MIRFKKISIKNFFNYGNSFTEVNYDNYNFACVIGSNGEGKSSLILESLYVGLFGKSFRKINKNDIVNNINKKNCVVQIEFEKNNNTYIIDRGIKPNYLKIIKNNEEMDSLSSDTDLQKFFEEKILQFDEKIFKQICIFGSSLYQPFMNLSLQDRRFVIENILNLQIFSNILNNVKLKIKDNNILLDDYNHKKETIEEVIKVIEKNIEENKKNNQEEIKELQDKIKYNEKNIEENKKSISNKEKEIIDINKKIKEVNDGIIQGNKLVQQNNTKISIIENNITTIKTNLKIVEDNENCPICDNILNDKESFISSNKDKLIILNSEIKKVEDKQNEIQKIIEDITIKYNKYQKEYNEVDKQIELLKLNNSNFEDIILDCNEKINKINKKENINEEELQIKYKQIDELNKNIIKYEDENKYYSVIKDICNDSGIKSFIIKKYIGFINNRINYYINKFELGFGFEFDEQFKENIKSLLKKDIPFNGLSEGQKSRLNFSILFSFIDVAKKLNSVDTNLLIFDEILDGSLDHIGSEKLIRILKDMTDKKIFVISHNTNVKNLFDEVIELTWDGLFSVIKDKL